MTFFFANIGYILTALFVGTAAYCIKTGTREAFSSGVVLGMVTVTAWIPSLWNDPSNMAIAHLSILVCALLAIHEKYSYLTISILFTMLACDAFWVMIPAISLPENSYNFPKSLFWWQSVLNLLFIFLSLVTIRRCYTITHDKGGRSNDTFYARHIAGTGAFK